MIDIGFIGLGTMGRPMAGHLQAAAHKLFLHDVVNALTSKGQVKG